MAYRPPSPDDADFNFEIEGYIPSLPLVADFDFSEGVHFVLAGTSNIFTAIWADPDAGAAGGKFYALSWGPGAALSVVDISNEELYDRYTQTLMGRGNEVLADDDTVDLNVETP